MNAVAIVAIVAMLLAFLHVEPSYKSPEVILSVERPVWIGFPPPLPYRNPKRN